MAPAAEETSWEKKENQNEWKPDKCKKTRGGHRHGNRENRVECEHCGGDISKTEAGRAQHEASKHCLWWRYVNQGYPRWEAEKIAEAMSERAWARLKRDTRPISPTRSLQEDPRLKSGSQSQCSKGKLRPGATRSRSHARPRSASRGREETSQHSDMRLRSRDAAGGRGSKRRSSSRRRRRRDSRERSERCRDRRRHGSREHHAEKNQKRRRHSSKEKAREDGRAEKSPARPRTPVRRDAAADKSASSPATRGSSPRKTGLLESKERERLSKEKPAPQTTTKAVCAPKSAASALIATKEESSSSYESSSSSDKEAGKDEKPESPEADTTQQSEPAKKKPQDKKEKDHVGKPQQAAAKAGNASAPPATASASAADNYEKHEQLVNSLLKTAITEGLKSLR